VRTQRHRMCGGGIDTHAHMFAVTHAHTRTLSQILTLSLFTHIHTLTHTLSLTCTLTGILSHAHLRRYHTHTHTHTRTHSLPLINANHSHTLTLAHTLTHVLTHYLMIHTHKHRHTLGASQERRESLIRTHTHALTAHTHTHTHTQSRSPTSSADSALNRTDSDSETHRRPAERRSSHGGERRLAALESVCASEWASLAVWCWSRNSPTETENAASPGPCVANRYLPRCSRARDRCDFHQREHASDGVSEGRKTVRRWWWKRGVRPQSSATETETEAPGTVAVAVAGSECERVHESPVDPVRDV
jgi:hypothetical protein